MTVKTPKDPNQKPLMNTELLHDRQARRYHEDNRPVTVFSFGGGIQKEVAGDQREKGNCSREKSCAVVKWFKKTRGKACTYRKQLLTLETRGQAGGRGRQNEEKLGKESARPKHFRIRCGALREKQQQSGLAKSNSAC